MWDAVTGLFRLERLASLSRGPSHLRYERPELRNGEWLVVDCHSHGRIRRTSRRPTIEDDRHDVKMALVIGNCGRSPSHALRLCAKGNLRRDRARADGAGISVARGNGGGMTESDCIWFRRICRFGRGEVVVVGRGGTGSALIPSLARLHHAMIELGHPGGIECMVYDDDTVSRVQRGPARLLSQRRRPVQGDVAGKSPEPADGNELDGRPRRVDSKLNLYADLVIGCVDSRRARHAIAQAAQAGQGSLLPRLRQ